MEWRGEWFIESDRSAQAILAAFAGNSIFWRSLPEFANTVSSRVFSSLVEWGIASILITSINTNISELEFISVIFQSLLFAYVVYLVIPRLLPNEKPASKVFINREFRTTVAVLVLIIVVPMIKTVPIILFPLQFSMVIYPVNFLYGWTVMFSTVIFLFLYFRWWRRANVDEQIVLYNQFIPISESTKKEFRRDSVREDWVGSIHEAVLIFTIVMYVLLICSFMVPLSIILAMLFPLPEFLVLFGGVVNSAVDRPSGRLSTLTLPDIRVYTYDLELRVYDLIRCSTLSRKSISVIMVAVSGFVISTLFIFLSSTFVGVIFYIPQFYTYPGIIPIWNFIGFILCGTLPGIYAMWFWIRETRRIPHYLVHWEEKYGRSEEIENDFLPSVTRPPGLLLPVTLLWYPVLIVFSHSNEQGSNIIFNLTFSILWTFIFGAVLWTVWWTRQNEPQPILNEGKAMMIPLYVEIVWFILIFSQLTDGIQIWFILLFAIIITMNFYFFEIILYMENKESMNAWRSLMIVGITVIVIGYIFTVSLGHSIARILILGGVMLVILSILLMVVNIKDEGEKDN